MVDRTAGVLATRRREILVATLLVVVVAVAVGGYLVWRNRAEGRAATMLADAMTTLEAPVAPPAPPTPGQPAPKPAEGTFTSEQARLEAALPKLTAVYTQYPSTDAGVAAKYHAANLLAALGRRADAEARYREVVDSGGLYADVARLGLAEVLANGGQADQAIGIYKELASASNSNVPVDGVLMQLAQAYAKAGRDAEARRTYNRIVQEFPESLYAAEAKKQIESGRAK